MKKLNQKGLSLIEGLLVIVALSLVIGIGYYVYAANEEASKDVEHSHSEHNAGSKSSSTSKTPQKDTKAVDKEVSYLMIKEWGVKVQLGNADPNLVDYELDENIARLELKSSVTDNVECRSLGVGISRSLSMGERTDAKKVGNYYYAVEGSPYACGNEKLDAIRKNYTGDNPTSWKYSESI